MPTRFYWAFNGVGLTAGQDDLYAIDDGCLTQPEVNPWSGMGAEA